MTCMLHKETIGLARTSLGHQRGEEFSESDLMFFKLCPIVSNYVQHNFQGGQKFCRDGKAPLRPPWFRASNWLGSMVRV